MRAKFLEVNTSYVAWALKGRTRLLVYTSFGVPEYKLLNVSEVPNV